jgi:hypothetical protein
MNETQVNDIIQRNNQELVSQMTTLITSSIAGLKRSNEDTAAIQMNEIKRIKSVEVPTFKKKSNEDQFKSTKAVLEVVTDAQQYIETKDLQRAKETLDKGIALLQERQRLILLADKSPYGWKTVVEYKQHDLAKDEEDDKKIYRAEARAARSTRLVGPSRRAYLRRSNQEQVYHSRTDTQIPTIMSRNQPRTVQKFSGMCFSCGKPGHWRANCPSFQSTSQASTK